MDEIVKSIVTIATAIIGIAILAVLVSPNARTSSVVTSIGNAFTNSIGVAEAPVSSSSNFSNSFSTMPY